MLTAEAQIETQRPSRYLVQLCTHATKISGAHARRRHTHDGDDARAFRDVQVTAEWSDTDGTIRFTPGGQCTIRATPNGLSLHVEAADEETLRQIQDIIATDLDRIGRRDHLTVIWQPPEALSRRSIGDSEW